MHTGHGLFILRKRKEVATVDIGKFADGLQGIINCFIQITRR